MEALAEEGRMPAALAARPDLPAWLDDIREAFWLLVNATGMNGGGMTALHLEPIRTSDALAIAATFGFEPLYFLRVIQPSAALYREAVTDRLNRNGHC